MSSTVAVIFTVN